MTHVRRMIARRLAGLNVSPCRTADGKAALPVTTPYGIPGDRWAAGHHTGEDYAAATGSRALAPSWGIVMATGSTSWGPAYGTMVLVRMANGRYDYGMCHLSRVVVAVGDRVQPGTLLGYTGATGNVTGPHLHFEARTAGGRYGSDIHPRFARRARL